MKITSLTLPVFVLLIAFSSCKKDAAGPAPDPDPIPVDGEQMNPGTGKLVHYFFSGNTLDASDNNKNGEEEGGLYYTEDRFGRSSRALGLDGTSSNFDTKGLKASFPFSISFWMNSANAAAVSSLFTSDKISTSYHGYWLQQSVASPGKLAFSLGDGTGTSGSSRNSLLSSIALSSNQWFHIVINVRGTNDMDLYINGSKDNGATYDGDAESIAYTGTTPTGSIGRAFGSQYYNGKIDDFRVYNRILTQTEVASLYGFQP